MCEPCNWGATAPRAFISGVLGIIARQDALEFAPDYLLHKASHIGPHRRNEDTY